MAVGVKKQAASGNETPSSFASIQLRKAMHAAPAFEGNDTVHLARSRMMLGIHLQ
jgi:hypothetical protein